MFMNKGIKNAADITGKDLRVNTIIVFGLTSSPFSGQKVLVFSSITSGLRLLQASITGVLKERVVCRPQMLHLFIFLLINDSLLVLSSIEEHLSSMVFD